MRYLASILAACLTSALCAGLLAFQMTEPAVAAQGPTCVPSGTTQAFQAPAPLLGDQSKLRTGNYIAVYPAGTSTAALMIAQKEIQQRSKGKAQVRVFTRTMKGLGVRLNGVPPEDAATVKNTLPTLCGVQSVRATQKARFDAPTPQLNPPRGLDRVDQRKLGPMGMDKIYAPREEGTNVHVYVLDSGIDDNNKALAPPQRTSLDFTIVNCGPTAPRPCTPNDFRDCFGHGTAVAGVIGGKEHGVAQNVFLHSVRVADEDCNLDSLYIAEGLEWVSEKLMRPAVVNISLSIAAPDQLDTVVQNFIQNDRVSVVVSAGNDHVDACSYSPAGAMNVITVGAMQTEGKDVINLTDVQEADSEPSFTNYGPCIELFAPGVAVDTAKAVVPATVPNLCPAIPPPPQKQTLCAGTSMAAAHVSGCAAIYLQLALPNMPTPTDVWNWLLKNANHKGTGGTDNWDGIISAEVDAAGNVQTPTDITTRHPGTLNRSLYCGPDVQIDRGNTK